MLHAVKFYPEQDTEPRVVTIGQSSTLHGSSAVWVCAWLKRYVIAVHLPFAVDGVCCFQKALYVPLKVAKMGPTVLAGILSVQSAYLQFMPINRKTEEQLRHNCSLTSIVHPLSTTKRTFLNYFQQKKLIFLNLFHLKQEAPYAVFVTCK